jgi:hypothetical protein
MKLRFSARSDRPNALMHLTVLDKFRLDHIVRERGEALCRPGTSLPNLEPLLRQSLDGRRCCPDCVDVMARARLKYRINLPPSAGVLAGDLIRELAHEREARQKRPRRRALDFPDRD